MGGACFTAIRGRGAAQEPAEQGDTHCQHREYIGAADDRIQAVKQDVLPVGNFQRGLDRCEIGRAAGVHPHGHRGQVAGGLHTLPPEQVEKHSGQCDDRGRSEQHRQYGLPGHPAPLAYIQRKQEHGQRQYDGDLRQGVLNALRTLGNQTDITCQQSRDVAQQYYASFLRPALVMREVKHAGGNGQKNRCVNSFHQFHPPSSGPS
jgi:hypothetical protein